MPSLKPSNPILRTTKVLLVMDVVESVRLMDQDEDGFVKRWQTLVQHTEQSVLPLHGGRIVKSLGDGLMLEFTDAPSCVRAAFSLHQFSQQGNAAIAADRQIHLRMGAHLAEFVTDKHDIYGTDVNLTARFCTMASPGDLAISADFRNHISGGLDADIEDLGECHVKHLTEPVQVYRAWPVSNMAQVPAPKAQAPDFRPTISVIPFEARSNEPEHFVIGELLAAGIIAQLSRSVDLRVISRLSSSALGGRPHTAAEVQTRLAASFVLSGSYVARGGDILILAELSDTRKNQVIWADRLSGDTLDLLQAQSELVNTVAQAVSRALIESEMQQPLAQPLPRL
jgi:TolB-like protein